MRYVGYLVAVAVIFFIISLGACSAQTAEQHNGAVDWLSRYGYMPPLDLQRGALQTHEGIERALRQMQRFAGIEETGRLDNATLTLMKSRRCSLPDSPASEDLWRRKRRRRRRRAAVGLRWNKADVTWSVHSYPSPDRSPSLHQTGLVELILTYALKAWSDAIPLDFVPLQGGGGAEGDIRVEFTSSYHDDGYPFDGAGGTLAHAFYPGTALMAGDTHFDDGESWSYGYGDEQGTSDLFTVAVHEFGHALGLSHSSSDVSIMKPYYQGSVGAIPSYTLPTDDRWAIQAVYGRRAKSHRPPTVAPTDPSLPNIPSPPPPRNTPHHPDPALPDRCTGRYDAVANIRGEVFFFKGAFFWRVQRSSLMSRKPALIHHFWLGLPAGLTAVDAVYERTDGHIVFFIGDQYWMFKDTVAMPGYPRPLDDWGMSTTRGQPPPRVEAAFVWTHNHKTYLFSEGQFWRFDESGRDRRLEAGYPRAASLWTGVPSEPDDIISWGDGNSYFFKDMSYWVLKRGELDLNNLTPKSVAVDWMQCEIPEPTPTLLTKVPGHRGQACHCDTSTAQTLQAAHWLVMLSVCFLTRLFSSTF